jgi:hypothetical protein
MNESLRRIISVVGFPYRAGSLPFVAGIVAYLAGFSATKPEVDPAFFVTAAQVIPVLFLVLAIEVRVFELAKVTFPTPPPPGTSFLERVEKHVIPGEALDAFVRWVYGAPILAGIVIGEVFAMTPLLGYEEHPRPVFAAMCAALVMIFLLALLPRRQR